MAKHTLTPELQAQIAAFVNAGAPVPIACQAAGVPWSTAGHWYSKGQKSNAKSIYREFFEAMQKAKATWAAGATLRVTKASDKDWKAAAWLLERRLPKLYARTQKLEHSGGEKPVEVVAKLLTPNAANEIKQKVLGIRGRKALGS